MAEAGLTDSVIGVAFDGTGYGTDGTVWGGEFLIASPKEFRSAGCLKPVRLFGSDESVKQGWKTAACYKYHSGIDIRDGDPRMPLVKAALDSGINTILSSSMGRLFDAVSAILNICDYSDYEGQCAIELENAAARCEARVIAKTAILEDSAALSTESFSVESLPYVIAEEKGIYQVDFLPGIRALCTETENGTDTELFAYRFHMTVCRMIIDMCIKLREESGLNIIALSGGVFQNRILLSNTVTALVKAGFAVYTNRTVPPGDGGISLGQAYIGRWA
jgi:hydrogenase maturation protein HypF